MIQHQKENCYRLQKSFSEKRIIQIPFPKSVHLHKNREWIWCDGWDDIGSIVETSAPIFTIEIRAIVKIYDRICACIHI